MKRTLAIFFFVLLVLTVELIGSRLPVMDWFYLHAGLVLAVLMAGATLWIMRRSRRVALLLNSAGAIAALAGVCAYLLYPLFESAPTHVTNGLEAIAHALTHALGPFFYAGIAMALGLFLGWLPAWLYLRSPDGSLTRRRHPRIWRR